MSQYNNMEYAQTEYQQCNNMKYNDNYYNGGTGSYDNYDSYDNYYDQGNNNSVPPVFPQRNLNERIPISRPSTRRPPPPFNNAQSLMGQMTPRPSPPIRPINSSNTIRQSPQIRPINSMNSIRNSPQIRPTDSNSQMRPLNLNSTPQMRPINSMNSFRQSPSIRPVNSRPIPTRKPTEVVQQPRSLPPRPLSNTMMGTASRSSPQLNPVNSSNLQNIPSRPLPSTAQRSAPSLQVRSNTTYISEGPTNSPKLPLRSQSSLSNLQKQQQKTRQPITHSNLANSNTLDDEESFELPIPPRTRQHRHSSMSSQGSNDSNATQSQKKLSIGNESTSNPSVQSHRKYSLESNSSNKKHSFGESNPSSRKHSMSHEQDMNHAYENNNNNQNYDYNYPQTNQRPPAPTPQYSQSGSYYNGNYNTLNSQQPQNSVPQGQQNYNYNNRPVNFHPQAMHNGIGNQYRPPPDTKSKPDSYDGKLPMTSLGGQPMPYGQSLEMYRQNAKKSNDPHVQLEFAKYLIAMAD
ncbi:hypothetical protein PIROE2DRAFT_20569, partial [Piromyces sp. E2]